MFVSGSGSLYAKFFNSGCHASDYMLHPHVRQLDDTHQPPAVNGNRTAGTLHVYQSCIGNYV